MSRKSQGTTRAVRVIGSSLLALAVFCAWPVHAGDAKGLHFERIGPEGGPPPEVVTAIYQDRTGFIWIGSRDGLILYDGHSFVVFEHDASNTDSISDNAIRTIYEDRQGQFWVGTNTGGLNLLDRGSWSFEHFRHDSADPRSISHDSVYSVLEDRGGTLWVGTQRGLNRFDPQTRTFDRILADPADPHSLGHDYIMPLYEDRAGRLWVGTVGGGLHLWDPESERFTGFRNDPDDPASLSSDQVFAIVEDSSGGLWVGTSDGLNLMQPDGSSFRRFGHDPESPAGLSDPLITSLAAGSPGTLWIGTHGGGLNELDISEGRFRSFKHAPERRNSLSDDDVISLLADGMGTLWVGTWGGGLNRLTPTSLLFAAWANRASTSLELEDSDVTALMHDTDGGIWYGTRSGFLVREDTQGRSRRFLAGGAEGVPRIILGLHEDSNGRVWIGASGGVLRLDPVTGELLERRHDPQDPSSLGPGYVKALLEGERGRMWVGTGEGGLHLLDREGRVLDRFAHDPDDPNSLSDDYVTAILEDRRGALWVGTRSGGLNAFDREGGRAERYLPDSRDPNAISHHYVTAILEDSKGRLWAGTAGGGLNRVDRLADVGVRFKRFTEADGLIDNDVMGVMEDDDGSLWLSTRAGISRFDPDSETFASIYVSDGLPSAEFEPGSVARSRTTLCFGTVKGLVKIPVGTPFPEPTISPTVITSIRTLGGGVLGDNPVWRLEDLEVPYGEWLSVELGVLDYSSESRHRYAYSLGEEWIELGSRQEITFTDLKPGTHEFSARGRNNQGVWSHVDSTLRIKVIPPFWMTNWFRGVAALFLVSLVVVGHQVRMSSLEKRNRELLELHQQREKARDELRRAYDRLRNLARRLEAAKEDERKRIARELHDDMGPSLTAVIINLQLLSGDTDATTKYKKVADTIDLVDRMVQRIRDLSLDLRPPLLDELGLIPALSGYLEAQSERTGVEIEVKGVTSTEGLQPEVVITAFRVVQEAVTNVIRHSGAKRATVNVKQTDGDLELVVKDEGRGFVVQDTMERAAAGKALGLLGMQERVRMLDGEVEIDSSPGHGTRVRARLPTEVRP